MNADRPDNALPLLLSIVFAAALLLVPMITHAADDTAEQPATTYNEQTMLAMNDMKADGLVKEAVRHANRDGEGTGATLEDGLALKLMMHRLAIGQ